MRILACAALYLALAALAGCSESSGEGSAWTADDLVDVDDATLVLEFNAYAESVDAQWEKAPVTVVSELLRLDSSDNPNISVASVAPAEAAEEATVTVTQSRLLDDSVEAIRNIVRLRLADAVAS